LTVINRESNGENILVVSNETTGGFSSGNIPKTELGIPTGGKGKGTIRRDDDVGDEVRVSTEGTAGVSVGHVISGRGVGQLPDNHRLVARRREEKVGVLRGGGEGGDPVSMAGEGSAKAQSLSNSTHCQVLFWLKMIF
jgi:hypothetical protein